MQVATSYCGALGSSIQSRTPRMSDGSNSARNLCWRSAWPPDNFSQWHDQMCAHIAGNAQHSTKPRENVNGWPGDPCCGGKDGTIRMHCSDIFKQVKRITCKNLVFIAIFMHALWLLSEKNRQFAIIVGNWNTSTAEWSAPFDILQKMIRHIPWTMPKT